MDCRIFEKPGPMRRKISKSPENHGLESKQGNEDARKFRQPSGNGISALFCKKRSLGLRNLTVEFGRGI